MCEEEWMEPEEDAEISTVTVRTTQASQINACVHCGHCRAMWDKDVEVKSYSAGDVKFDKADFIVHYCSAVVVVDCVTGAQQKATCSFARDHEGLCGSYGDLFMPKH